MNYVLNIKDAGKLLDRFGYKGLIRRGKGEMKGDVSWDGLPFALDIPSMYGKLSLKIGCGSIPESGCRRGAVAQCYQSAIIAQKADA